jgi:DNA-binding NtrC family response regulator
MQTELKQFTSEALEKLSSYSWPGNARQLENEIKCLVASVRGKSITEDNLDASIRNPSMSIQSFQPKWNRRRRRLCLDPCRTPWSNKNT